MEKKFINVSANENNPLWNKIIMRETPLYKRDNDLRTDFERDYTRVIYTNAYRRMKHKTQVFFSPTNDHICTRIEHVNNVESISYTIANALGLNTSLTKAIATAHDIGHSPFGHRGEKILSNISQNEIGETFWHEKNGLDVVDKIELLEDNNGFKKNLDLTYGVRDGIISHCGEVNEKFLKPREEFIDLQTYITPNQYSPFTWEGCVVKISDKISYISRDIEDAILLGLLDDSLEELHEILKFEKKAIINNSVIINKLIFDLCTNSNPDDGLIFSDESLQLLDNIKAFNYKNIYYSDKVLASEKYFELVLTQIFEILKSAYDKENTLENLNKMKKNYNSVVTPFIKWINCYWNLTDRENTNLQNKVLFDINNEKDYLKAIIYYISGMTDNYAIECYNNIIGF